MIEASIPARELPGTVDADAMGLNLFVYDSDTQDLTGQTRIGWSTWGGVQGDPYRWGVATLPGWDPPEVDAGEPVVPSVALSSLRSPQSIAQAVRTGVALGGGPAAAAGTAGQVGRPRSRRRQRCAGAGARTGIGRGAPVRVRPRSAGHPGPRAGPARPRSASDVGSSSTRASVHGTRLLLGWDADAGGTWSSAAPVP